MPQYIPTDEELEDMIERINAFIIPNVAATKSEKETVRKAALKQYEYEMTIRSAYGDNQVPDNVESFRIGNFAMSFKNSNNFAVLSKKNIAPVAYAILLNAGLLYRGVR